MGHATLSSESACRACGNSGLVPSISGLDHYCNCSTGRVLQAVSQQNGGRMRKREWLIALLIAVVGTLLLWALGSAWDQ